MICVKWWVCTVKFRTGEAKECTSFEHFPWKQKQNQERLATFGLCERSYSCRKWTMKTGQLLTIYCSIVHCQTYLALRMIENSKKNQMPTGTAQGQALFPASFYLRSGVSSISSRYPRSLLEITLSMAINENSGSVQELILNFLSFMKVIFYLTLKKAFHTP